MHRSRGQPLPEIPRCDVGAPEPVIVADEDVRAESSPSERGARQRFVIRGLSRRELVVGAPLGAHEQRA